MDVNPINFPSDEALTGLAQEDLDKLIAEVTSRGNELMEAETTPESVDELDKMGAYAEKLDGEVARRETEAADLNNRKESAGNRFKPKAETDAPAPTPEAPPAGDPNEGEGEGGAEPGEGDPDEDDKAKNVPVGAKDGDVPMVEAIAAAVSAAVTAAFGAQQDDKRELVAAGVRGDARALAERLPGASRQRQADASGFMAATSHVTSMREGTPFESPDHVAEAIANKRKSFTSSPTGTRDYLPIAHADKAFETHIGFDAVENFTVLRELQTTAPGLVASGVACAAYAPSYDFFRLAEPQNPVENGLQVVQAPRGGINYIVPPSVAAAAGAIDISAQDRDYDEDFEQFVAGPKACVAVSCPATQTAEVSAVSQCVTFDNLNYKVFPEQVAAFLEDVAVQFTSTKEVFYLDYINSQSTQVTADLGYGASSDLLHDWELAAVAYRKRHGMAPDADLTVMAPDWAIEAIKTDMALNPNLGLNYWDVTTTYIEGAMRARNLQPIWYNDNPTGITPNQKFNGTQSTGALNAWPDYVFSYIFAPGTFVRLDGGTLDVGLIRDSVLNRTNDLQLFMEEWIGAAKLGFESIRLRSKICVNGGVPGTSTLKTCA